MEKILVKRDNTLISNHMNKVSSMKWLLQKISEEYLKFQVGHLEEEDLYSVIDNPEGFIRKRISDNIEAPQVAGFAVKKELLIEQLELPSFAEIKKLCKDADDLRVQHDWGLLEAFTLDEGEVSIMEGYEERFAEQHSVYATTEMEIAFVKELEKFRNAWNDFDAWKKKHLNEDHSTDSHRMHEVRPYDLLNIPGQFSKYKSRLA